MGQIQNGSKMCGLLKNLAQKVLNDQPAENSKDSKEASKRKSKFLIKRNDEDSGIKNDSIVPSRDNLLGSNGNLIQENVLLAKRTLSGDLETGNVEKNEPGQTNEVGKQGKPCDPQGARAVKPTSREAKEAKNASFKAESVDVEEIEAARRLSDILTCIFSSDKTSNLPYRPMAEMLINIGFDAAKIHVCKDVMKDLERKSNSKLSEGVKQSIGKVKEVEKQLGERFKPYSVPCRFCRCGRECYSDAELASHKRIGWSTSSGWFRCCFCSSFRTRSATLFVDHLCDEHGVRGTTEPSLKNMCNYCSYENRDWRRAMMHEDKCRSRFVLSRNLTLVNNDIMIYGRPQQFSYGKPLASKMSPGCCYQGVQSSAPQNRYSPLLQTSSSRSQARQSLLNDNFSSPRPVHSILPKNHLSKDPSKSMSFNMQQIQEVAAAVMAQAQMQMSYPMKTSSGVKPQADSKPKTPVPNSGPSCEICSASVTTLESLLKHMQLTHQINIKSIDFFLRGKGFVCKTCFQGFWTQLGLNRHQQQVHNSKQTYPCFICGPVASTDILTHLMTKHNISLQDMLLFGWCYICKAETKTPDRFLNHMLITHSDLFPSKSALESMVALFKNMKSNEVTSNTSSQTTASSSKPTASKARPVSATSSSQISFTRAKHRCNPCQMKFANAAELESHYGSFHTVSCTRCKEKWTTVEAMLKHFNQIHYNEKDPCILCKEHVKIGVPMIRHMKRMHVKKCVVVMKRLSPSERMKYLQMSKRSCKTSNRLSCTTSTQMKVVVQNCEAVSN